MDPPIKSTISLLMYFIISNIAHINPKSKDKGSSKRESKFSATNMYS